MKGKWVGVKTSLDSFLQAHTMESWFSSYPVCVCVCVHACFRSEDVDKLSDPGKQQQPQPRSIFDFEPGKTNSSSKNQVRHHRLFDSKLWYHPWIEFVLVFCLALYIIFFRIVPFPCVEFSEQVWGWVTVSLRIRDLTPCITSHASVLTAVACGCSLEHLQLLSAYIHCF